MLSEQWSRANIRHRRLNYRVFNIDLHAPAEPIPQAYADKAFQGKEWEDGYNAEAVADLWVLIYRVTCILGMYKLQNNVYITGWEAGLNMGKKSLQYVILNTVIK